MLKRYLWLNLLLVWFSLAGILAKFASGYPFLSPGFLILYGIELIILAVYAIAWQQIIKEVPISQAYSNRAVIIVWSCIWGVSVFHEHLSASKIFGCFLVTCGVFLCSKTSETFLKQ